MHIENNKIPVICIVGPTASGKTNLSVDIAVNINGEIISGDSMQVYKEFNIITAKPNVYQLQRVKHYMIDIISVQNNFSVADYIKLANYNIKNVVNRHKIPIIIGGTGLYIDSLLSGITFSDYNNKHNAFLDNKTNYELFDILKNIDFETSIKVHPNNRKKVIHAIDFYYNLGYPISTQVKNSKLKDSEYSVLKIGLSFKNRQNLYDRINNRVDNMIHNGLLDEVKKIFKMHIGKTAREAIGYKEMDMYLKGEINFNDAVELLKRNTRRYAKRQLTWFRRDENINWIFVDEYSEYSQIIDVTMRFINDSRMFNKNLRDE